MSTSHIHLITKIKAPMQTVFDLSRDIDLHKQSMSKTMENAIDGRTSGRIEKGETVTWRGKHFGVYLKHTSVITEMECYYYFVDEMLKGHFASYRHEHFFETEEGYTLMTDNISYAAPYGWLGKLFDKLLLKSHLTRLIKERNIVIKQSAEKNC